MKILGSILCLLGIHTLAVEITYDGADEICKHCSRKFGFSLAGLGLLQRAGLNKTFWIMRENKRINIKGSLKKLDRC